MGSPEVRKRIRTTLKQNKSYLKSRPEDRLYAALSSVFRSVERQAPLNGWDIDFLVHDVSTYVQLDGVYWHGLDRPIEQIRLRASKHDVRILGTMQRDVEQNHYCATHGIRLVRITDRALLDLERHGKVHEWIMSLTRETTAA